LSLVKRVGRVVVMPSLQLLCSNNNNNRNNNNKKEEGSVGEGGGGGGGKVSCTGSETFVAIVEKFCNRQCLINFMHMQREREREQERKRE